MPKTLLQIWRARNQHRVCVVSLEDLSNQEATNQQTSARPQTFTNPQTSTSPQTFTGSQTFTRPQNSTSPQTSTSPQISTSPQTSTCPQTFTTPTANTSHHSIVSVVSDGAFCRICHEGDGNEPLLSICKCTGTVAFVHRSCIEQWLNASNTSTCDLCKYEIPVLRKPKPFKQWLLHPASSDDQRNLIGDFVCFLLLSPLASVSAWTCITGALQYASFDARWECAGLIFLTVFLIHVFLIWCCISIRYHYQVWQEWKVTHQFMKLHLPMDSVEQPPTIMGVQDINNNSGRNNVSWPQEGSSTQPSIRNDIPQVQQQNMGTINEEHTAVIIDEEYISKPESPLEEAETEV